MYIKDKFLSQKPVISIEVFPPKKDSPIETVYNTLTELEVLEPDFISVTYGEGGSNKGQAVELSSFIKNQHGKEALCHLTCVNSTKQEITDILDELESNNIENILALRGDIPKNSMSNLYPDFLYAKDLIKYIKHHYKFCVGAACYPEGHIECSNLPLSVQYLKEKVDAGADFLITQLFLDNNYFYDFYDIAIKQGIDIPISAGIMPVLNMKQIEHITSLCGSQIPVQIKRIFGKYGDNQEALIQAGIAYATEQIIDLISWGIDGIHLYTMNKPEIAKTIMNNLSYIR